MLNTKYIAYIFFSLELTRPLVCPRSKRFAYYRKLRAKNVGRQRRLTEFFAIRFSEKNSRNRFFEGKKEEKEGKENVDQRTRVDTTKKNAEDEEDGMKRVAGWIVFLVIHPGITWSHSVRIPTT